MSANVGILGTALALGGGSLLFWGPSEIDPHDEDISGLEGKLKHMGKTGSSAKNKRWRSLFSQADRDNDGSLHARELHAHVDRDKDGMVSKDELLGFHLDHEDSESDLTWLWALLAVLGLLAAIAGIAYYVWKRNVTPPKRHGTLRVHAMRGKNLKKADSVSLRATLGKKKAFQSNSVPNNEGTADFKAALEKTGKYEKWVFPNIDVMQKDGATLSFDVLGPSGASLCKADIPARDIAWGAGHWETKTLELKEKGKRNGAALVVETLFEPHLPGEGADELHDYNRLAVKITKGSGLKDMNKLCKDAPYVVCQVKGRETGKFETKTATNSKDGVEPVWNDEHFLDPWHEGESLEFTVLNQGMLGSRTEGKATLEASQIYPSGFKGALPVEGEGMTNGKIFVDVHFPLKKSS